jgi:deoxyribonuclease V
MGIDPGAAIRIQEGLQRHLVLEWDGRPLRSIAGVEARSTKDLVNAAIVVLSFPDLSFLDAAVTQAEATFPYFHGLLAFHFGSAILSAWLKLTPKPDLLLVHGHGIAHPRRFGLASHVGFWLNTPTVGVAKSRLYGIQSETSGEKGAWSELRDEQQPSQIIGAVLRTCDNVKPIYVSAGHLIDLEHSLEFTLTVSRGYRMPEPLRIAHQKLAGL